MQTAPAEVNPDSVPSPKESGAQPEKPNNDSARPKHLRWMIIAIVAIAVIVGITALGCDQEQNCGNFDLAAVRHQQSKSNFASEGNH